MPKHFSENEKQIIYQRIIEESQSHWAQYGIKRTSVADLCKAVGIAKGSFYNFFDSKEDLLVAVFKQTEHNIRAQLMTVATEHQGDRRENFRQAMSAAFLESLNYPWLLKLQNSAEEYHYFLRKLTKSQLSQLFIQDRRDIEQLLAIWQINLNEVDVELVSATLRAIYLQLFHKTEIGEAYIMPVINLQLASLADYIFGGAND